MKTWFTLIAVTLTMTACAHHRDVRPGVAGVHRVVVKSEDRDNGAQDAISQANHYCEQFKKSAAFIEEGVKYTGDMDEKDYKKGKTIAKVAQGVGGAAWVLGGRNESNAGGIVGLGGSVARGVMGEGYTTEMKFKCQ